MSSSSSSLASFNCSAASSSSYAFGAGSSIRSRERYVKSVIFDPNRCSLIASFAPNIIKAVPIEYQATVFEAYYSKFLDIFRKKLGKLRYKQVADLATCNIQKLSGLEKDKISPRLLTLRIFFDLFKTIRYFLSQDCENEAIFIETLRTLFPNFDLSSPEEARYNIHPEILVQMCNWIKDRNLVQMTNRIKQVVVNLRTPLANHSFPTLHGRSQEIRSWLRNNAPIIRTVRNLNLRCITSIPPEANQFINLESLSFDQNPITSFPSLAGLVNLQRLRIIYNPIRQIPAFVDFSRQLVHLDLSNNALSQIAKTALRGLVKLKRLDLSNNQLRYIPSLAGLIKLKRLIISNNRIEGIAPHSFVGPRRLRLLDLANNQISYIAADTFAILAQLNSLVLSSNRIEGFAPHAFRGLDRLTYLDLADNQITKIPNGLFVYFRSLESLFLLGNPPISQLEVGAFAGLDYLLDFLIGDIHLDAIPDIRALPEIIRGELQSHLHLTARG